MEVFERGSDLVSHLSGEEMSRGRGGEEEPLGGDLGVTWAGNGCRGGESGAQAKTAFDRR